jgi:pimeloyl-ACP methyl ester carboxylesterase
MSADLRAYLSEDPNVAAPALTRLAIGITAEPDPGEVVQRRLGELLSVPPRVRKAMFKRSIGSADVLAGLRIPVLIAHGTADRVVDPSVVEYAAGKIPGASVRWFQEVGHLPFAERVAEFDGMLREFADRCGRTPE